MKIKSILLGIVSAPVIVFGQASWTPYIANYTQTAKVTNTATGRTTMKQIRGQEERATNGSILTTVVTNGMPVTGKLLNSATGQLIEINYADKRAVVLRNVHYQHTPSNVPIRR